MPTVTPFACAACCDTGSVLEQNTTSGAWEPTNETCPACKGNPRPVGTCPECRQSVRSALTVTAERVLMAGGPVSFDIGYELDPCGHIVSPRAWNPTWPTGRVPEHIRGDGPCGDCGTRDNIIWFTDNALWNRVIRPQGEADGDPFLCVTCFVVRVDKAGLAPTGWRLIPDWHWETTAEYDARRARTA